MQTASPPFALSTFSKPYDWAGIDQQTRDTGGAILSRLVSDADLEKLDAEVDSYLQQAAARGKADSGSERYDQFLGHNTVRLHGLIEKFPSAETLVGHAEIVDWATRILARKASSILLNAGELIQINPGEPHQAAHRDTDSWPIPRDADPFIVNAIVALDDFTIDNGATAIALGSWGWNQDRRPRSSEYVRAVMQRGDAVLFRGDLIHGGGANRSSDRRRAVSLSYCAGWLRTVENSYLNVSRKTLLRLPAPIQALLGYDAHDGESLGAGLVGLYENGDPRQFLAQMTVDD